MDLLNFHLFLFGGFGARLVKYWSTGDFKLEGKMNFKKAVAGLVLIFLFYIGFSFSDMSDYYATTNKQLLAIFAYIVSAYTIDSTWTWLVDMWENWKKRKVIAQLPQSAQTELKQIDKTAEQDKKDIINQ